MWELLTEKDRMAQKELTISMTIRMILNCQEKEVCYLPAHLNPFNFDSPRFRGLVKGHLDPGTIWGLGLEIQNLKTFILTTFIFAIFQFFCKKSWFFPFTRTCMSCAMLSLSDKMSPRFFVPKTFLNCWTTLWWLSDKLTSMWSLPRALCFDCSHPR